MLDEIKKTIKHSAIYGFGNILSKFVGLLMIPVYTRYLTPEGYGIIELLFITISILGSILKNIMDKSVMRYYFDYDNVAEQKAIISTSFLFMGGVGMFIVIFLTRFSRDFSGIILGSPEHSLYFKLIFLILFFDILSIVPLTYLKAKESSGIFTVVTLTKLVLILSLNIYLIVFKGKGVIGALYGNLVANLAIAFFLILWTFKEIKLLFSLEKLKKVLTFGLPLVPTGIAIFSLTYADRYFLKLYTDLDSVGIYALGYRFGILLSFLITQPFLLIWSAQMFEIAKKDESEKIFSRFLTYFSFIFVFCGLGLSLFIKEILRVVAAPSFLSAYKIVPILTLGYFFMATRYHFEVGILIKKKTKYLSYILGGTALLNLLINYLFIQRFGMMGAAYATTLSFFVIAVSTYFAERRIYPINYELTRILKILCSGIALFFLGDIFNSNSIILLVVWKGLLFLAFPFVLYLANFFSLDEKRKIREVFLFLSSKIQISQR